MKGRPKDRGQRRTKGQRTKKDLRTEADEKTISQWIKKLLKKIVAVIRKL